MPKPADPRAMLFSLNSSARRWPGALRAALAIFIPGAVALLLGYHSEMFLIAAGGCAVIYGEGHPYRARFRVMLVAGLLVALGATAGAFVGSVVWGQIGAGGSHWWLLLTVLFCSTLATLGGFLQNALRLRPPGSFFIVMVAGGSTMVARIGFNPVEVGLWTMVGVVSGVILGMLPALVDPYGPQRTAVITLDKAVADFETAESPTLGQRLKCQTALFDAWTALGDARVISGGEIIREDQRHLVERTREAQMRLVVRSAELGMTGADTDQLSELPTMVEAHRASIPHTRPSANYRIYRSMNRHSHAMVTAEKILLASLLAGTTGIAMGLYRPDWAIVSALLMLQWGPDRVPGQVRGLHRLIGSLLGVGLFAVFHLLEFSGWTLLVALAICQFGAEVFVVKNYAVTVIFTTPLALLLGNAVTDPLDQVVYARTLEVTLSILAGSLILWLWRPRAANHDHQRLVARSKKAMGTLIGALATKTPQGALEERRDLQYELLSERRAIQSIAQNDRPTAYRRWEHHQQVQRAGYGLLDFCNANAHREVSIAEIAGLAENVRGVYQAGSTQHPN
ncbi:FUSC family protein [Corynebacterium guangdongense]|uniref:Integral membrane bound transporter domain-containing protein n=2 Tax=Corynebacterium guangdongense TaxID=1783348 RepID=A0ABU2A0I5_9CORY|nr:FUSC family protein [Corynebacterium guangdongense]MDR7330012.1 hypothetical protein [Corynebacterium guangdongense]